MYLSQLEPITVTAKRKTLPPSSPAPAAGVSTKTLITGGILVALAVMFGAR